MLCAPEFCGDLGFLLSAASSKRALSMHGHNGLKRLDCWLLRSWNHDHLRIARFGGEVLFKFLPFQLWMVGDWPTMALTGNGELGCDSGEGA